MQGVAGSRTSPLPCTKLKNRTPARIRRLVSELSPARKLASPPAKNIPKAQQGASAKSKVRRTHPRQRYAFFDASSLARRVETRWSARAGSVVAPCRSASRAPPHSCEVPEVSEEATAFPEDPAGILSLPMIGAPGAGGGVSARGRFVPGICPPMQDSERERRRPAPAEIRVSAGILYK